MSQKNGTAVATVEKKREIVAPTQGGSISPYASESNFEAAQRMARALAQTSMVPKDFRDNIANCLIAMELSNRVGASVFAVMQSLYIVHGKPAFEAKFKIASVNKSGRFSALRYQVEGDDPTDEGYRVRAYATELATGERLDGEWISWPLVKAEGWHSKKDSKWLTMPGKMFRYRAASWWVDVYAPDISMGMMSADEAQEADWVIEDDQGEAATATAARIEELRKRFSADEVVDVEPIPAGVDPETGEVQEPELDGPGDEPQPELDGPEPVPAEQELGL